MRQFLTLLTCCMLPVCAFGQTKAAPGSMQQGQTKAPASGQMGMSAQNGQNNQKIKWYKDYKAGMQAAQKERKPVVLYFTGSDWCGWCKKMDQEIFDTPDFVKAAGNKYVFIELDFPMKSKLPEAMAEQNAQLKQQYSVTGYPTVILLDTSGNLVGEAGYRSGGGKSYATFLDQFFN